MSLDSELLEQVWRWRTRRSEVVEGRELIEMKKEQGSVRKVSGGSIESRISMMILVRLLVIEMTSCEVLMESKLRRKFLDS